MNVRLYFTIISCLLIILSGLGIYYYKSTEQSCDRSFLGNSKRSSAEIFETDGLKHSVDLAKIIDYGIKTDSIPVIEKPEFIDTTKASEIFQDSSQGIGVEIEGESKFYPIQVVLWHSVVNDCVGGQPVLVSFCPLCLSSVVYSRKVGNDILDFKTNGKTFEDSFIITDTKTKSEWSTLYGEAITGDKTGTLLEIIPSSNTTFGLWKKQYPGSKVLSVNTGFTRPYTANPYINLNIFDVLKKSADSAVNPKELVIGINIEGSVKAYPISRIKDKIITDNLGGKEINIVRNNDNKILVFVNNINEEPKEYDYLVTSWLIWNNVYKDSLLYLN